MSIWTCMSQRLFESRSRRRVFQWLRDATVTSPWAWNISSWLNEYCKASPKATLNDGALSSEMWTRGDNTLMLSTIHLFVNLKNNEPKYYSDRDNEAIFPYHSFSVKQSAGQILSPDKTHLLFCNTLTSWTRILMTWRKDSQDCAHVTTRVVLGSPKKIWLTGRRIFVLEMMNKSKAVLRIIPQTPRQNQI